MIYVKKAKYLDEYKINILFSNNKEGTIDLRQTIFNDKRKIFKELRNIDKFKKFKVSMDTVVWSNGLDLAPEFLYDKAF